MESQKGRQWNFITGGPCHLEAETRVEDDMTLALGHAWAARTAFIIAACSALVGCAGSDSRASSTGPDQAVFALEHSDLELSFPMETQEVRTLPDGREMYGAHGTVTNKGSVAVDVPTLLAVFRDKKNQIVFTQDVRVQKRRLEPGEVLSVDDILVAFPKEAKFAEIGWKREQR